ncbi:MAG: WYL domain-containing protein [Maledivibacter sp.]|jgi:predicted DNA-binding transcriptional regulator YafY|nr:WYL domain-containing protein [Maledivibacter sp.]
MDKLYNAIKILQYLKYRGKLTSKELAGIVGVGERQVRNIINELESADGIFIERTRGRYGGYKLISTSFLCDFGIDKKELMALETGKNFLKENLGYYLEKEYELALEKIKATMKTISNQPQINYYAKATNSKFDKERDIVLEIQKAIFNKRKIRIQYFSVGRRESSKRIVHPYMVYNYQGFLYLVAYCENNKEFRDFKLIRIEDICTLNEEFISVKFDFDKFIGSSFGIFKDNQINVKLKIKYPHSVYVKESVYIQEQQIEDLENGDIIFQAVMQGKPEIMSWIKSMGADVEILEPIELREELIREIKKIQNIYL